MEKKRLSKALAAAGVASRRACEELIFSGQVTVNGETVLLPQTMVNLDEDELSVGGEAVGREEPKKYYISNKPRGYICSNKPGKSGKCVLHFFAGAPVRLFTVGRLDKDTTGLLLVTNDGTFANLVIHPSSNIQKEYLAKTQQEISASHLQAVSQGALVEGVFIQPVSVKKVRKGTVKVVVMEGKKHEVRILLENAGLKVMELKRIRLGGISLGNLPEGFWKEMSKRELESLFSG